MTLINKDLIYKLPDHIVKKLHGAEVISSAKTVTAKPNLVGAIGKHFYGQARNIDPKIVTHSMNKFKSNNNER
jgi:hypothetical protein